MLGLRGKVMQSINRLQKLEVCVRLPEDVHGVPNVLDTF